MDENELRAPTKRFRDADGETTSSFLLKIMITVFVVAAIAVEALSPVVTRLTLDNDQDSMVDTASTVFAEHGFDPQASFAELASQIEQQEGAKLERLEKLPPDPAMPNSPGTVKMTVLENARSFYITKLIPATSKYYQVQSTFTGSLRP